MLGRTTYYLEGHEVMLGRTKLYLEGQSSTWNRLVLVKEACLRAGHSAVQVFHRSRTNWDYIANTSTKHLL